jgi:hypothetical protein
MKLKFIAAALITVLLATLILFPASTPVTAQGTIEDQIFAIVARNIGIGSYPTKGQLDKGDEAELAGYAFPMFYETDGLDLNASGGTPQCNSRVLADGERIVGWVGYRVNIRVQNLRYEFRTNGTGSQIIRCQGGQSASMQFGGATSLGATRSGWDVTDQAMRHISTYLELSPIITRADVDAAYEASLETGEFDYPHSVSYRWDVALFTNSALNCPASGQEFNNGPVAGYRITLTVNGRSYSYRSTSDGNILILCLGGRADPSSIGVSIPSN